MAVARGLWVTALAVGLCAAALQPSAGPQEPQPQPQDPPPPSFRGFVNFVRVDVIVTDSAEQPVMDLEAADFELLEDGVPQAIEQFKAVRIDRIPAPDQPWPRDIRTTYDEEIEAARDDVRLFVIYIPGPLRPPYDRVVDPLVRFVRSLPPGDMVGVMDARMGLSALMLTRDREATVRQIRRYAELEYAQLLEKMLLNRDWLLQPLSAVQALELVSLKLASLREGRQSILFVGSSISTGGCGLTHEFSQLLTRLNRNNTSVYVVDPTGLTVRSNFCRTINLRAVAEETGGRAIVNTNNIQENLARVTTDASFYYLLGYASPAPVDGKFHRIGVRVTRPDLTVRARSGFWAFSVDEMARSLALANVPMATRRMQQALAAIAPPPAGLQYAHTWLGVERGTDGRARVAVVWEPVPPAAGERRAQAERVAILATTAGGAVVFDGASPEPGTDAAGAPGSRAPRRVVFDAPAGLLDVRLQIESAGGVLDLDARAFEVPDLSPLRDPSLSTPRVFAARTLPELRAMAADGDRVPTARREFARTDRLLVRFDAYGAGVAPAATLRNRRGERMFEVPVVPATAGGSHQLELGLTSVPPGEYLIEIVPAPDEGAGELIALRIR